MRRPAWQASLAGLIVGLIIAITVWSLPVGLAFNSVAAGVVLALWPIMWIVVNALLLYNVAVESRRFDAFRAWVLNHLPNDRRVVLVVIGFCFGALLEGIAGFGTPVAITSSLLILVGFPALDALVLVLIFNTAPVAFGALGVPVTVLGAVTGLPSPTLGAMVGRQLPFIALLLPFYVMALYGGMRSLRALWPVLLVAGGSFALCQFVSSNFINYALTDVLASLGSLIVTLGFLQMWKPAPDPEFAVRGGTDLGHVASDVGPWQWWLPWILVSIVVIIWTTFNISAIGQQSIHWPGLDKMISITLYQDKPYGAVWAFQPLGTGTAILLSAILTAALVGVGVGGFMRCVAKTLQQAWIAILTVCLIVGLAYLMNYSGMAYTLGLGASSVGRAFVFVSPFLGWIAVFLSGSDTSGNALFGNLQVVAAKQLNLDPVLFAATNSSGGVMGKMISPQNIATGVSVTDLRGQEGVVFARTFWHSVILTLILGVLVALQQYVFPGIIPTIPH
jgi:lactate permease